MKTLFNIISALGAVVAVVNEHSPLAEVQRLFANRRRVFAALAFAVGAFSFLITSVVTTVIEGALQLEAQGFLLWSPLFSAAAVFASLAMLGFGISAMVFPHSKVQPLGWAALDQQFQLSEHIEKWIQQLGQVLAEPPGAESSAKAGRERAKPGGGNAPSATTTSSVFDRAPSPKAPPYPQDFHH